MKKPGGPKRKARPWGKIGGVVVAVILIVATGWYIYNTYFVVPAPMYARFVTAQGSFDVELFPAAAPGTVANFVKLVNQGFYNHQIWHRIVKGFVIQTGDLHTKDATNSSRSSNWGNYEGVTIPFENDTSEHNTRGSLAMASTSPGIGISTQFYINVVDNSANLDGKYVVFGQILNSSGLAVMDKIGNLPVYSSTYVDQPIDLDAARIISITIISKP